MGMIGYSTQQEYKKVQRFKIKLKRQGMMNICYEKVMNMEQEREFWEK